MSGVDTASITPATHDNSPIYISDDERVKLRLNLITHGPDKIEGYPFLLSLSYLGSVFETMYLDRSTASKLLRADNPLVPLADVSAEQPRGTATVILKSIKDRAYLRRRLHHEAVYPACLK